MSKNTILFDMQCDFRVLKKSLRTLMINTRIGTDLFRAARQYVLEMGLLDRAPDECYDAGGYVEV